MPHTVSMPFTASSGGLGGRPRRDGVYDDAPLVDKALHGRRRRRECAKGEALVPYRNEDGQTADRIDDTERDAAGLERVIGVGEGMEQVAAVVIGAGRQEGVDIGDEQRALPGHDEKVQFLR